MTLMRTEAWRRGGVALVIAVVGLTPLFSRAARAQEQKLQTPGGEKPAKPQRDTMVLAAKYVKAGDAARILKELLGERAGRDVHFGVDDRTNSVIVSGSAEDIALLKRILTALDVPHPRPEKDVRQLAVFPLRNTELDRNLEEVLKLIFTDPNDRFALDREHRSVIVYADRDTLHTAEGLLNRLDQAPEKAGVVRAQVRIVWLATGLPQDAPKPPADLKNVLDELAKIGIEDPRLVSQLIVNTLVNKDFEVQGSGKPDALGDLRVSGMVLDKAPGSVGLHLPKDTFLLNVNLDATRAGEAKGGVCRLQTSISAPAGHSVVLGLTPTAAMTSVFVVQVSPK
jgi:hypothetical protein